MMKSLLGEVGDGASVVALHDAPQALWAGRLWERGVDVNLPVPQEAHAHVLGLPAYARARAHAHTHRRTLGSSAL